MSPDISDCPDRHPAFLPTLTASISPTLWDSKGGTMDAFWIFASFVFVFGTLAVVAFAMLRMFGGGHWRHH